MDSSTKEILKRTVSITETHVESDQSGVIEEKVGDVSIEYNGYAKYDVVNVNDSSNDIDKQSLRHTHLYLESSDSSTYFSDLYQYYIDNNLYPTTNFFDGNND